MSRASVRVIGALWVLLMTSALAAQTSYVSNGTGNWSTSTVWLPQGVPGAGDAVTIRNNDQITVTGTHTVDSLVLDASSGTHKLNIIGGTLNVEGTGTAVDLQAPSSFGFSLVSMQGGTLNVPNGDVSIHGEASTFGQLDFTSGGGTVAVGGSIDFAGSNPAIARLTFNDSAGGFLSIGGDLDSGGGVTGTYATVTFTGNAAQTVGGPYTLLNAIVNKTGGYVVLADPLSLSGNLQIVSGLVDDGGSQITMTGLSSTVNIASGGVLKLGSATTATAFPMPPNPANVSLAANSAVSYHAGVPQNIATSITYRRLYVQTVGPAVTHSFSGALLKVMDELHVVKNGPNNVTLAVGSNTLDVDGSIFDDGTITTSTGSINVGGNWGSPGVLSAGSGTVTYDGTGPQSVLAATYHHLTVNKTSGTATLAGNIAATGNLNTVAGTFDLNSFNVSVSGAFTNSAFFSGNGSTLTLLGDLTNSGSLFLLGGTLKLNGTVPQTIDTPLFAFNAGTLELNNLAGATLNGLGSVSSNMTLNGGNFTVSGGGFFLIAGAATVTRTSGWFVGKLRMDFGVAISRTMHVGTSTSYMPVDINPGSGGTIEAEAVDGLNPNRTGDNTLNRYWRITAQSSVSFLNSVTFHYNQSDVGGGTEGQYVLAQFPGSGWLIFDSSVDSALNTGSASSVGTYVADWVIGQRGSVGGASTLAITSVNGGTDPYINTPFSVDVEARGDDGISPGAVSVNSSVDVLLQAGSGSLLTASGNIAAGFSNTTVTGLSYDTAESNVQLRAVSASGDSLQSGNSALFDVLAPSPTLTVTSLADSGPGSLRDVLTTLNGGGCTAPCTIDFSVAGTITLLSALPPITFSDVTIDGFTAPGASPNTNAFGLASNATLTVILDGGSGTGPAVGLEIQETFVRIRGLVIQNFQTGGAGIGVKFSGDNSGSRVSGCYIGTSANGLTAAPNNFGVVFSASSESSIGGTTPADRNVISGNTDDGVLVSDELGSEARTPGGPRSQGISAQTYSNTNSVNGSYIGTKADLSGALPNSIGISVCGGCSSTSIGGSGIGNVIGGNTVYGIRVAGSGATVTGNRIGTAGSSPAIIPNAGGIEISGNNNTIGGVSPSDVNVISASTNGGIYITGDDNTIDHNLIGVAADGTTPAGNLTGISLSSGADRNQIGAGFGNTIAYNVADGVLLSSSAGFGNSIRSNAIFSNGGHAIDFDDDGVTANDATDADAGPNHRQNYPVLNNAVLNGGNIDVKLSLDSSAGVNVNFVRFDVYQGDNGSPAQAPLYLGSSGCMAGNVFSNVQISVPAGTVGIGDKVVATVTAYSDAPCVTPSEGTSELSPAATVTSVGGSAADLDVSSFSPAAPVAQNTAFTFDFFIANNGPDPATNVVFTAPIPAALTFTSVTAPCTYAGGTVSCTFASIASGNNASLTISLSTTNAPGTHTVTGSATATETDPDGSNNSIPTSVGVTGNALTVVNTNNSGTGSLRQALLDAQNNVCVSPCAIGFNIPAPPYVIQPPLDLPPLGSGTTLDATTQPGYSGTPLIELDLAANINSFSTLTLNGTGSTIRGFALTNGNNGITINGDSNTVQGNFIGLTPTGNAAPNDNGIVVTGNNNSIGGTAPTARNVISGNFAVGVRFETDATGNSIAGNYLGIDPTGTLARPNGTGIELLDTAAQTTIGGSSAAHRNVISGNVSYGIRLKGEGVAVGFARRRIVAHTSNAVSDTLITNNWIGSNANGNGALGNGSAGIKIEDDVSGTVVGVPGQGNYISGNNVGINVPGVNVGGTKIAANSIGVAPDGITAMGNTLSGIVVAASYLTIGGPGGNGNIIANNGDEGIELLSGATNHITQNSIFNNAFLGIDLNDDGVTANDPGDADSGPNGRQNFPTVTSAVLNGGNLTVAYNIDSSGSGAGSIGFEIYKADSAASGEGKTYLGFACIVGNNFGVGTTFPAAVAIGDPIVLTATSYSDAACTTVSDGTSEFSAPVLVTGCAPPPATITASGPTTFCTGGSVTLTASAGASYFWSTGATTQAITVNTSGSYSVTVTDGAGCPSTSAPTTVTVNPPPVVNITGPTNACDSAILDAGPGFATYAWSTGATTQTITVTSSNTYSVTVTTAGGCSGSDTHSITVNPTPAATITPSGPTTFCTGGSVTLTANPAGASYSWSNGATTQSITVTTGGSYSVTVTGAGGCFNTSAPTNVIVNPAPLVNISGPINACDSAILDAGPGFSSYLWSTGATTQTITVTSSNTYSVTVTNGGGCSGSDSHSIAVNPTPVATITPSGPTTFCTGGSVTLTANPAGASYSWSNGATTQSITVTTGGSYSVTVTGAGGCFNTSAPTSVTVNPAPLVNITGPVNACDSAILDAGPGFSSYLWSTGATTQTITVTSSNTYSVTVTNAGGCTGSDSHSIAVNPTPVATITPSGPTTFCTGGSVTLTANPAGASYSWSNGATTQSITVTTGGSYSVTVTGAGGCFNTSAPTSVIVNPAPIVNITGPTNACDSAILDAGPGFTSYLWSTGATTQSITVTSSNTYSVTVSNGSCTASDSHSIAVNPTPVATITPSGPTTFCTGGSVTLTANPAGASYSWSNGATTQSITVTSAGSYSVTVTGAGGCFNTSAPTSVNVTPAPIINITGPASACDSAILDAGAGFTSYLWSTGATTQTITVTSSNTYSVTVSNGSCTATDSHGIIVNPTPAASITPSGPTTFCAGGSVTLTANPAGASYLWSNGATTQSITVTASGAFSVTVTGAGGCSNTSAGTVVTVDPAPAVTITGPNSACASAVLDAGPGFASYLWSTGQTTQSIAVFSTNTYSVTVTNGSGCTASDSHSVVINAAGAANISGPASMCPGQTVVLDAGPGYTGYLWSTGETTQSISVSPAGTMTYTVNVTDGNGCNGTDSHTLTVNPAASASITPGGPTTFCSGGSVTLTANAAASYLWSTGATTQSITVNAGGSYSVTVTEATGCSATSAATTVTVNPAAAVTITGPTATCAAAPVILDAGAGFATYSWSTGETSQTITVAPASTATYSVTVTNGSGCSGTDSHTVTVTSNPVAAITAPPSVCSNGSASASVAPIAGATYTWSIANGTFTSPANGASVTFTAGSSGSVTLSVTVASGTCTSSGSQTVPITAPPVVTITGPTQTCPNTTFTLNAGSGFAGYLWSNGATTPSISLQQGAATQTYSVTVTDASGCSATDSHTVTLGTAPSASISAPSSATAHATGLTASVSAQPGATYAWNITNGTITAGLGTNAVTFTAGGSGTTKLTITVTLGSCSASGQRSVNINGAPPVTGADLSIVKTAPSTVAVAGSLTYTITVANAGPQAASNLTVTDPLPDGAALVSIDSPSLTCNRFSNVILCNGSLGINATKSLTLTVTAPPQSGLMTNTATVNSEQDDSNPNNNSASATTNVLSSSDPCAGRPTVTPLSPVNGSVLTSSAVDFQWTAAGGAAGYRLWLRLDDGPATSTDVADTSLQLVIEHGAGEWWIETLYEGCPSTESQHLRFTVPQRNDCTTATPQALAPANSISVGGADVTFTWSGVPGALSYEVWLSPGGSTPTLLGTTSATSLTHLVPAGALEWFVRAIVDRCPSRDSQRARFTFAPPAACLDNLAPHALTPLPDAKIARAVDFSWTATPRATSYELFVVRGRTAPQLVATTPNPFARGITLATGRLTWFVRTHFSGGCPPLDTAGQKLEIVAAPPACAALRAPSIFAAGQISSGLPFTIQWDDIAGATGYELQLASTSTFSDAQTVSTSGTEHVLTRTNNGATPLAVYARVRALDSRCQPATTTAFGPVSAIFILPPGTEGAAPLTGGPVSLRIDLGPELAGQSFTVSVKEPWLTVVPTSGIVAAGGTSLAVTAETTGLPLGTSLGAVRITLNTPAAAGRVQANATTVRIPTMGVSKVTPVTPAPKSAPPPDALIIPAVAHADGINAKFQSDVRVTNSSAQSLQYQLTFTATGGAGSANGRQTTFSIEPGRTIALDDILRTWFGTGGESVTGTLEVRPLTQTASAPSTLPFSGLPDLVTFAASRTFNATANGTFGQYIPAIPFANFIGASNAQSNSVLSLQQIAQSDRYRTNLGIVEGSGEAASLLVKIFGSDGAKLKEFPVTLAGGEHTQLNSFLTTQGVGPLSDGRVEISVISGNGKVTAYASVLDNATSDPLLVTPVALNGTGNTKWVVPGVADLDNGTANWQTDMRLFNAGTADVDAALTFYSLNGGTPKTATVTIPAGQVRQFDRTLATVFGAANDGGAVHIATATEARLVATARTYNQTSSGTYGQFISGITPAEAAGLGSRPLQILQVEETDRFRSNIGLAEVTGNPVKLELSIIPPDAKFTAVTEIQLQANEFRQINALLRSAGLAETYNARVTVRVIEGTGRVTAYASVIDMLTNDPTYVPAQ